jgi:hypothetical protein
VGGKASVVGRVAKRLNAGHPVLLPRALRVSSPPGKLFELPHDDSIFSNEEVASKPVGSQPVELSEIN